MQNPSAPVLEYPTCSKVPSDDVMANTVFDESSIEALLRSETIPDGIDISQISRYVDEAAEKIHRFDDEILRLEDDIHRLHNARKSLQRSHDLAKGLFAPVRRMPVEILGEIFKLSADHPVEFYRATHLIVLRISQVCRRWRHTTRSMPRLWAGTGWRIFLHVMCPSLHSHYLLMSHPAPLSLHISDYGGNTSTKRMEILELLLSGADRWYSVTLDIDTDFLKVAQRILRRQPRPLNGYFPNLTELEISIRCDSDLQHCDLFEDARNLSSLTLSDQVSRVSLVPFTFPYSQLKAADLFHDARANILPQFGSSLESLALDFFHYNHRTPIPLHTLPNLSELKLKRCATVDCSGIFRALTLPSLKILHVNTSGRTCDGTIDGLSFPEYNGTSREWPLAEFRTMISRSACSLQALRLTGCLQIPRSQLHELFSLIPMLTCLEMQLLDEETSSEVYTLLTIQSSKQHIGNVLLPCLMDFKMNSDEDELDEEMNSDEDELDEDELAQEFTNMTKSRQPPSIPGVAFLRKATFNRLYSSVASDATYNDNPTLLVGRMSHRYNLQF